MSCPRCKCRIPDGFYCLRCGYVPTEIDLRTNTEGLISDTTNLQVSRGILKAPSPDHFVDMEVPPGA